MKEDIKQLWIAALKSGEYKQGKGALTIIRETGEEDCCLGVLCKLAVKAGVLGDNDVQIFEGFNVLGEMVTVKSYGPERDYTALPEEVRDWAGLQNRNPYLEEQGGVRRSAAGMNDGEHLGSDGQYLPQTFDQIAFAIEATEDL